MAAMDWWNIERQRRRELAEFDQAAARLEAILREGGRISSADYHYLMQRLREFECRTITASGIR